MREGMVMGMMCGGADASLVMHDMPGELGVGAGTAHHWRRYYDVGIFVAMGSANEAQKAIFDRLRVCMGWAALLPVMVLMGR
jgi:hypothetical protein